MLEGISCSTNVFSDDLEYDMHNNPKTVLTPRLLRDIELCIRKEKQTHKFTEHSDTCYENVLSKINDMRVGSKFYVRLQIYNDVTKTRGSERGRERKGREKEGGEREDRGVIDRQRERREIEGDK